MRATIGMGPRVGAIGAVLLAGCGGGGQAKPPVVTCPAEAFLLDPSAGPGPGVGEQLPKLESSCSEALFVVSGNGLPPWTHQPKAADDLTAQSHTWRIPRLPTTAAAPTPLPRFGAVGFSVTGLPIYGPNDGPEPVAEAYGDPLYNTRVDDCLGHTSADGYHLHALEERCHTPDGLVAEPWRLVPRDPSLASPVIGFALDGFPIYGPSECVDAACSATRLMKSGYLQKAGERPRTEAARAFEWRAHPDDPAYLDECNGHASSDPDFPYHYHATETWPYVVGCLRGTPAP